MRRVASFSLVLLAGCAAATPAPVTYGRGAPPGVGASQPPPRAGPAPIEMASARAPRPAPAQPAPTRPAPAAPPSWAAGPGTPLSVWALQPEAAAPFDPRAQPRRHVVAPGDTLFSISVRYQIPLRPLIETNKIDAPFTLTPGQALALPPPRTHRVRRGETLTGVARRYNIDARSLALLNRLEKPFAVAVGDTLVLPALARGAAAEETPAPPAQTAPPGTTRFAWPLRGRILTPFGPQPGGRRSDGVDIQAAAGAAVAAAADGEVVYAGDDLDGYGRLMLVQHAGGWITAYAHCAAFGAQEGDRVRQGQKIAAAAGERVHFQVRRGAAATDPLPLLPPI